MRVLLAEDDARLAEVLVQGLTEAGWEVEAVGDGLEAYGRAQSGSADVLLLDWMLPGIDGLTVCRRLRDIGVTTPVLVLTARGEVRDRIHGLDAGADDYLAKPFDLDELLARLRALVRRTAYDDVPQVVTVGDLVVDAGSRRVSRGDVAVDLSAREFDILWLLASRVGKVVSRFTILDEVWDGDTDVRSNVIDVHLGAIRAKVDKPFGTRTITTVRGAGYRLEPPT